MRKIHLKGLACLGRYERFEDVPSVEEGIPYSCSHCGHIGSINTEEYRRSSDEKNTLNNSSEQRLAPPSGKSSSLPSSIQTVVNDLGLTGSTSRRNKKNVSEKQNLIFSSSSSTLMKKLLSFKRDESGLRSSPPYVKSELNEEWVPEETEEWFRPGFDRDSTTEHLSCLSPGSFIVRRSKSRRDALALSIKTQTKVAHFLILILPQGAGYRIKGSKKTFTSLRSLIVHHSVMSEVLPCPLVLPSVRCGGSQDPSETEDNSDSEDDIADISNYPDLLLTLRETLYATQQQAGSL